MEKFKYTLATIVASIVTMMIFALIGAIIGVVMYVMTAGIGVLIFAGLSKVLIYYFVIFGGGFAGFVLVLIVISAFKGEI